MDALRDLSTLHAIPCIQFPCFRLIEDSWSNPTSGEAYIVEGIEIEEREGWVHCSILFTSCSLY